MSIFSVLPIKVDDASLPFVSTADVDPLNELEFGAYEHWIFDSADSSVLTGKKNGKALTVQNTAPVYSSNFLTIKASNGNALLSDKGETAATRDTMCVVFRQPAANTGLIIPFGTLTGNEGGGGIFASGTSPTRKFYSTQRGVTSSTDLGATLTAGNWYFLACSRDFYGSTKKLVELVGGSTPVSTSASGAYAPSAGKLCLGTENWTSANQNVDVNYAEAMIFGRALTAAELAAVYARSKARMAKRGITVV